MQMNLFENIKIFIEIVDAGSFAQAAENLQIHRPAVTKALQQLEQAMMNNDDQALEDLITLASHTCANWRMGAQRKRKDDL